MIGILFKMCVSASVSASASLCVLLCSCLCLTANACAFVQVHACSIGSGFCLNIYRVLLNCGQSDTYFRNVGLCSINSIILRLSET